MKSGWALRIWLVCAVGFTASASRALATTNTTFEISTLAPMPIAVQEIYPTVHQGEIYVAGGLSSALPLKQGQMTNAVQIFNPTQNRWRLGPALPEARHHAMLVSTQDALWLFGGFVKAPVSQQQHSATADFWQQGNWMASADVLTLPNDSKHWQKVATLPAPLAETVSFVIGDNIHLVSGRSPLHTDNREWGHHTDTTAHYVFDYKTRRIETLPAVPTPKNSAAIAVIAQQPYWLGGRNRSLGNLAGSARFDIKSNRWQTIADMPQAQAGLAAVAIGSRLYALGGEGATNSNGVFAEIWCFDPTTATWQAAGQMQPARHGHGAVAIDNTIYLMGGATAQGLNHTTALMQLYRPMSPATASCAR